MTDRPKTKTNRGRQRDRLLVQQLRQFSVGNELQVAALEKKLCSICQVNHAEALMVRHPDTGQVFYVTLSGSKVHRRRECKIEGFGDAIADQFVCAICCAENLPEPEHIWDFLHEYEDEGSETPK